MSLRIAKNRRWNLPLRTREGRSSTMSPSLHLPANVCASSLKGTKPSKLRRNRWRSDIRPPPLDCLDLVALGAGLAERGDQRLNVLVAPKRPFPDSVLLAVTFAAERHAPEVVRLLRKTRPAANAHMGHLDRCRAAAERAG